MSMDEWEKNGEKCIENTQLSYLKIFLFQFFLNVDKFIGK